MYDQAWSTLIKTDRYQFEGYCTDWLITLHVVAVVTVVEIVQSFMLIHLRLGNRACILEVNPLFSWTELVVKPATFELGSSYRVSSLTGFLSCNTNLVIAMVTDMNLVIFLFSVRCGAWRRFWVSKHPLQTCSDILSSSCGHFIWNYGQSGIRNEVTSEAS